MADYGACLVLVLLEKIVGARERNLIDVLVNLVGSHAKSAVTHGNCLGFLVNFDANRQIAEFAFKFAFAGQRFQFLGSINGIRGDVDLSRFVGRHTIGEIMYK